MKRRSIEMNDKLTILQDNIAWANDFINKLNAQMAFLEKKARETEKDTPKAKSIEIYYALLNEATEIASELITACKVIEAYLYRNEFLELQYTLSKTQREFESENLKLKKEIHALNKFIQIQRHTIAELTDEVNSYKKS
ncbi:MAG: hypothetical protein NZ455_02505 [Bacteroidia bacterium]|nr:hypothetical protein [Bacteroidia bacterium]MDW8347002.1 hypothetical protein [Bacteroidia bacterium]